MTMKGTVLGLLAAAGLALAGCGEEPAPTFPTYERDIKPLMQARCVRCHGAGGTLNLDPDSAAVNGSQVPIHGYFTQLADINGDHGLLYYTKGQPGAALMTVFLPQMPPAPAPALTDRELDMLNAWLANPLP